MKKLPVLFALILLLAAPQLQAQKRIGGFIPASRLFKLFAGPTKPAPSLEGRWIRTYDASQSDYLVFTLAEKNKLRWGNYLEFLPGQQIAKGYSAPCGNDTNIHRHDGTYKIEFKTILIDLKDRGTLSYRIIEQQNDKLVLDPLN